jgi:hypothetical protein
VLTYLIPLLPIFLATIDVPFLLLWDWTFLTKKVDTR